MDEMLQDKLVGKVMVMVHKIIIQHTDIQY